MLSSQWRTYIGERDANAADNVVHADQHNQIRGAFLLLSTRTPYLVGKALDCPGGTAGNEHFERMQDELALHRFVAG
jgi:hypothetical protein